jgi:hypothetical protein
MFRIELLESRIPGELFKGEPASQSYLIGIGDLFKPWVVFKFS